MPLGVKRKSSRRAQPRPVWISCLTLDLQLQQLAERLLEGHSGSIVALDPRNGQILALASQPAFDPNAFVPRPSPATWRALSTDPHFPLHNRATQGQYPPGSVFKIVTALGRTRGWHYHTAYHRVLSWLLRLWGAYLP